MALAVEWLPEEWPDGIPSLKQLLVVAPLTTSILLPIGTEITTFAGQVSQAFELGSARQGKEKLESRNGKGEERFLPPVDFITTSAPWTRLDLA